MTKGTMYAPPEPKAARSAKPGAPDKIYLVPRDGGIPVLAAPERRDRQLYPSWSSQGNSILFSSYDDTGENPALWTLDLKSRGVALLPGTTGLHWGQISPDGNYVVALTDATEKLVLYDITSQKNRTLAERAEYPRWSSDGKYVYFRTPYFRGGIENPGVYRWRASTNTIEKVLASPGFPLTGVLGVWSSVTPEGAPLLVRDMSTHDIYRLDVELP